MDTRVLLIAVIGLAVCSPAPAPANPIALTVFLAGKAVEGVGSMTLTKGPSSPRAPRMPRPTLGS